MFDTTKPVIPAIDTLIKQDDGVAHDENADKRFGAKVGDAKGLAALAGNATAARRSALGDKSNVVQLIPGATSRNLRSTTLQSRTKNLSHIAGIVKREMVDIEQQIPMAIMNKENIIPNARTLSMMKVDTTPRDWDDLDAEDADDPLMVSEYVVEIFDYMRQLETQKELNWHSRSVLIDWLVEVQWKLKLLPETLFLTTNIIDRFLSKRSVSLVKLQLVGMAATLLASKYEEVLSPSISNFIYLADNAYDEQELLKAERYMLHVLDFSLAYPSPLVFLRRISKAEDYDVRSRTLAKYLMELCLLDTEFVCCPPSMVAAVSINLAREMLKSGPWTANLRHYSGEYSKEQIQPWVDMLIEFLKKPLTYEAVYKKYALKKMMKASLFVAEWMKRHHNVSIPTVRDNGKSVFSA